MKMQSEAFQVIASSLLITITHRSWSEAIAETCFLLVGRQACYASITPKWHKHCVWEVPSGNEQVWYGQHLEIPSWNNLHEKNWYVGSLFEGSSGRHQEHFIESHFPQRKPLNVRKSNDWITMLGFRFPQVLFHERYTKVNEKNSNWRQGDSLTGQSVAAQKEMLFNSKLSTREHSTIVVCEPQTWSIRLTKI